MKEINNCSVCGGNEFYTRDVLWPELVADWQLSPHEVEYVNRQQGFYCTSCGNNLRSMVLANAIFRSYCFSGTLNQFVESDLGKRLKVLEINEAGGLSPTLRKFSYHQLVRYPEYDMTYLQLGSDRYDLVIHSDTLEHVPNPEMGLSECRRI